MDLQLWSDWGTFWGAVVGAALVYLFAVAAIRLAGRRTLAQMSAYDIVVTIALGTLAASTAVPPGAAVADGLGVLVTFLLLQVLIGAVRQRSERFRRVVDFAPVLLVRDGHADLPTAPTGAQLTLAELESRLRQQGVGDLSEVRVAVLEPTGELSVTTGQHVPPLFSEPRES